MSEGAKIALVTGASRGIGKAIAIELGNSGFTVIGTATTAKGADNISSYLSVENISGEGLCADVSSDESVATLLATIAEKYGLPSVVVNNAGITRDNLLMRMKEGEWNDVMNTNLGSMFRVCKACVKGMTKARWGRIINISSVGGSSGNAGQTNYAASKAGIDIKVKRVPTDGYWSDVWNKEPLCVSYWSGRPTEDLMLTLAFSNTSSWNETRWNNEHFEKLLIDARAELDETKRRDMYWEMQRLINVEGGLIAPVFTNTITVINDKVGTPDKISATFGTDGQKGAERWWFK